ncbi:MULTISPECIES: TraB/GumN family protein [unclassified Rhizobium]|uniref:TraB/GumN family protein n=1 Tax=unclassified Rhizobium TaxID=2613769 RepID=UPI001AD9BEF0|nr:MULTISPECIES: TraB/GumN family protein [unclassified Rhizobium]MBO9100116.1 TraB/GumN family protein [Rhizobium sp. L58/93]MBO9135727.1 TraB/GumN family protein [Rhizobium sp. B209b/85]MBO9170082.1 TraB/GumN family protein [Rhizobium sp. L245/93]MBO9186009.1 TraB/GumN family protein [Rhizobium sp. E27B/91]QXZ82942.1 TraB/GumN family protein [Rhizobium sp. K1/93]
MTSVYRQKTRPAILSTLGNAGFWAAASLPLAFAVTLVVTLASFAPAHADDDAACGGRNLLAELQKNDPAKYASFLADGDKVANGHSIFWKIEKPGVKTSWLLGTMHVTDPRVLVMPKGAAEADAKADTIIVESDEILDEKKATMAILARPDLTMLANGATINSLLPPADAAKLEAGLAKRGITLGAVSHMQPWMISSVVALPSCELSRKAKGAQFLDQKIANDAAAAGKQVKGLETLVEQLQAMADLPAAFHLKSLIETLQLGDKMNDVVETMTDLYLSGNAGATMAMLKVVTPDGEDTDSDGDYATFEQRIILDRNKVMAERAAPILANGNVFMAVGALHLSGEQGLVELFRKQGFTLTVVD